MTDFPIARGLAVVLSFSNRARRQIMLLRLASLKNILLILQSPNWEMGIAGTPGGNIRVLQQPAASSRNDCNRTSRSANASVHNSFYQTCCFYQV